MKTIARIVFGEKEQQEVEDSTETNTVRIVSTVDAAASQDALTITTLRVVAKAARMAKLPGMALTLSLAVS